MVLSKSLDLNVVAVSDFASSAVIFEVWSFVVGVITCGKVSVVLPVAGATAGLLDFLRSEPIGRLYSLVSTLVLYFFCLCCAAK